MKKQIDVVIQLSRWREYSFYYMSLVVLVFLFSQWRLSWDLFWVFWGNYLGLVFAFMVNEVEDAPEDALDGIKRYKNPIANGSLSYPSGWYLSICIGIFALCAYALAGLWVYLVGVLNILLSFLYSWRYLKLKRYFIVDIVSHGLILGGLQFLACYLVIGGPRNDAFLLFLIVFLASVTGQLFNQLRDVNVDRKSGHQNTVSILGQEMSRYVLYATYIALTGLLAVLAWKSLFPFWFVVVFGAISTSLFVENRYLGWSQKIFVQSNTRKWAYICNFSFTLTGLFWWVGHWF